MKIYLAARYSRREELCTYRDQLRALGHHVQARWLDGKHQLSDTGTPIGDHGEALVEGVDDGSTQVKNAALRSKFAQDDWEDVNAAQIVISFTEPPRSLANRGGRHVEYGIALANGDRVIVVGYRENIFHWLPQIEFYETWEEAKRFVLAEPMKPPMQPESNGGVRVQRVVRRRPTRASSTHLLEGGGVLHIDRRIMPLLHKCWRCEKMKPDCAPDEGDCGWWCLDCIEAWEKENNQHWADGAPLKPSNDV